MQSFINSTKPANNNPYNVSSNQAVKIPDNSLKQDTFELSSEKKVENNPKNKVSLKEKILTGLGIGTAIATAAFLIYKNKTSKLHQLPKHIDFAQAKTYEEAIEFGNKVLKIENYEGFTSTDLDVLNWINEGMVNMSNMHKGKLRIPKNVRYTNLDPSILAAMCNKADSPNFGRFTVNKNAFDDIDKTLAKFLDFHNKTASKGIKIGKVQCQLENPEIQQLIDLYTQNKATYNQKVQLLTYIIEENNTFNTIKESSAYYINYLLQNNVITSADIGGITFEELLKKPIKEQRKVLVDVVQKINDEKHMTIKFAVKKSSPFSTVYHEFGHLQDMVLRTPAMGKYTNPNDYPKELLDWLNDPRKMQIANCVSSYATTGPGEFIAEVFASSANGNKINPDVEKLYNELGGPKLPKPIK